jgi:hypothetical protein
MRKAEQRSQSDATILAAVQPAVAADRFAREIGRILTDSAARSRQLSGNPLGGQASERGVQKRLD